MPRMGLTPSKITDAAMALADAAGPEAVTVPALAERLGVKAPALYKHLPSLAAIHRSVALRSLAILHDALSDAAIGRSGFAAIEAMAHAYRTFAKTHPGAFAALTKAPPKDDAEWVKAAFRAMHVIARVLDGLAFPEVETVHLIRAYRSALHGFLLLELQGGFGLETSIDESFERLVALLLQGFAAHERR